MSCHRHAARSKQHYFLLACQSGTFFENNASKPTIKSRFSSDSRLKRALISAPATVSFFTPQVFAMEFFTKFQSCKQVSYFERDSRPLITAIYLAQPQRRIITCSKLIFLYEKLASRKYNHVADLLKNSSQEQVS